MKISLTETNREFTITLSKPGLKYIDFFLSQKCAGQLVTTGFYPSAKEISETVGVFDQARRRFVLDHRNPRIAFLCIGDGKVPRTGLYAAYMTNWQVMSIDPAMAENWTPLQESLSRVHGLTLYPETIERVTLRLSSDTERIVLAFVHSHASLRSSIEAVRRSILASEDLRTRIASISVEAVSLPCCINDDMGVMPNESLEDDNILSARKMLHFYENIENSFLN